MGIVGPWNMGLASHSYHLIQQGSYPHVRESQRLISNQTADQLQSQLQPMQSDGGEAQIQGFRGLKHASRRATRGRNYDRKGPREFPPQTDPRDSEP